MFALRLLLIGATAVDAAPSSKGTKEQIHSAMMHNCNVLGRNGAGAVDQATCDGLHGDYKCKWQASPALCLVDTANAAVGAKGKDLVDAVVKAHFDKFCLSGGVGAALATCATKHNAVCVDDKAVLIAKANLKADAGTADLKRDGATGTAYKWDTTQDGKYSKAELCGASTGFCEPCEYTAAVAGPPVVAAKCEGNVKIDAAAAKYVSFKPNICTDAPTTAAATTTAKPKKSSIGVRSLSVLLGAGVSMVAAMMV